MKHAGKYLWGSACLLYVLSVMSTLMLGYWDWWVLMVAILALATFGIWRRSGR